jgi:hypothetical protein
VTQQHACTANRTGPPSLWTTAASRSVQSRSGVLGVSRREGEGLIPAGARPKPSFETLHKCRRVPRRHVGETVGQLRRQPRPSRAVGEVNASRWGTCCLLGLPQLSRRARGRGKRGGGRVCFAVTLPARSPNHVSWTRTLSLSAGTRLWTSGSSCAEHRMPRDQISRFAPSPLGNGSTPKGAMWSRKPLTAGCRSTWSRPPGVTSSGGASDAIFR